MSDAEEERALGLAHQVRADLGAPTAEVRPLTAAVAFMATAWASALATLVLARLLGW